MENSAMTRTSSGFHWESEVGTCWCCRSADGHHLHRLRSLDSCQPEACASFKMFLRNRAMTMTS